MVSHRFARGLFAAGLLCAWAAADAQPPPTRLEPPAKLEPLPEPPPPPPGYELDPSLEPQVTIIQRGEEKIEEFRINGRLYMIKVTPRNGPPYYLIDYHGNGDFIRRDGPDPGFSPPLWVIHRF
ncbi:DUF2782 domain-containing protein [Pelomicrobium methylotrophicum]|uniref:DUF2782 domain-containing protein n=2 Tax=Pelomicrobium methylotrophicum TaxID=2602750 RepID=A0A5C7F2U8_9PROT|nr:DUF2782 domain-containing protein [Pelomicrobium methylotrophicum]